MKFTSAAVAALALSAALTLAGCAGTTSSPSIASSAPTGAGSQSSANSSDAMFATMMIPHHEQAVEMSDIVLAKDGVDQRVLDLATAIKAAQGPEIDQMKSWLTQWGVDPSSLDTTHAGHGSGMVSAADLESLKNAPGVGASKLFLQQMIGHHVGAVGMAQMEVNSGQNADAVALAKRIITSQTAEIEQMRTLIASL